MWKLLSDYRLKYHFLKVQSKRIEYRHHGIRISISCFIKNGQLLVKGDTILSTKKNPKTDKISWDVHFWLGLETSQDEQGVAAYKTVELDDHLGGAPVQYREVQEHESQLFLSYFRKGITYLEGGIESGFRKVEKEKYVKRLLQVKGRRNVRVKQVKCSYTSLNTGDVFILDCGETIYVWNGPKSRGTEKMKGMEVAKRIRDEERFGKAVISIIDTQWDSDANFYRELGDKGEIASADEGGNDDEFEKSEQKVLKLYSVCDAKGELEITEVGTRPLKREMLDSDDCFILDTGPSGIYVWIGKNCTDNERKTGWSKAMEFIKKSGYPEWTPVTRLADQGETPLFKQFFQGWTDAHVGPKARAYNIGSIAQTNRAMFDAKILHKQKAFSEEEQLPDDGSGGLSIWRIYDKDMHVVKSEEFGTFYSSACYIVLYACTGTGGDGTHIIYYWQGKHGSKDDIAASAMFAQMVDENEVSGKAVQIRVTQGQEPEHFLRIFQGKLIVLKGDGSNPNAPEDHNMLFHIRGSTEVNTRAQQVDVDASSLNSGDAFVLIHGEESYLWIGKGASKNERKMAKNVMMYLTNESDPIILSEGKEPKMFWEILGGKKEYSQMCNAQVNGTEMHPRLFHCSNASGNFTVEEVVNFAQEDLYEDDVMLLDTYKEIYVWIGKGANETEKKESLKTAMDYIKSDPSGRTPENTLILQVKQGAEPLNFKGCFQGWDPTRWAKGKSYDEMKQELQRENDGIAFVRDELSRYTKKYNLKELRRSFLPRDVDPTCKEKYLTDEDFHDVFKMTQEEFYAKPKWKQIELKKRCGLF